MGGILYLVVQQKSPCNAPVQAIDKGLIEIGMTGFEPATTPTPRILILLFTSILTMGVMFSSRFCVVTANMAVFLLPFFYDHL